MHVVVVGYEENEQAIRAVRDEVFVKEQGVPPELEHDARDKHCLHIVAFLDKQAVGTARLDTDGRMGRMAVLAAHRRLGIGSLLVDTVHDTARKEGHESVWCHAQAHAIPFYERFGYRQPVKSLSRLIFLIARCLPFWRGIPWERTGAK